MGEAGTLELERRATAVRALLSDALGQYGRLVYANSLGAEAVVLTHIIWSHLPQIEIFSIDTGRLHAETHELRASLERRYRRTLRVVSADAAAIGELGARQETGAIYRGVAARLECCRTRKLEPFRRAIAGFPAWITGVRREQSAGRAHGQLVQWDAEHGIYKISPLLEWSEAQVWQFIRLHRLPYNPLHDRHFPSIGCAPCTRAIQPGESRRAGRWWWEQPESRECGLHPPIYTAAAPAGAGAAGVPA
jgi:phosphoadenosine phosphosulfate reductase